MCSFVLNMETLIFDAMILRFMIPHVLLSTNSGYIESGQCPYLILVRWAVQCSAVCHQGSTKPDIYIDVGHGTLFYSIFSIYFFVFVDISTQNRTNESY